MELTKESFEEFMKRLQYHNKGEGVERHITADPIFNVQNKTRTYGLNSEYSDTWIILCPDRETDWDDVESLMEDIDEEGDKFSKILEYADCQNKEEFLEADEDLQIDALESCEYDQVFYQEGWEYVSSHFTREAAEAFIERKGHDYRELRVYVDAQVYCWEWNMIVKGLLSGEIGLIE